MRATYPRLTPEKADPHGPLPFAGRVQASPGRNRRLAAAQQEAVNGLYEVWKRLASRAVQGPWTVPSAFGVTSAIREETRTTNALGFALALASETNEDVLFAEADMRGLSLALDLGMGNGPTLKDYVLGQAPLVSIIHESAVPNLKVIFSGTTSIPRSEPSLTGFSHAFARQFGELVQLLKERFAYVVFDLPPIMGDPGTEGHLRFLDGTLLVVRSGVTPRTRARQAAEALGKHRTIGVMLVGPTVSLPRWLNSLAGE